MVSEFLIHYLLVDFVGHAVDRRLVGVVISIQNLIILIIKVNEVQIVLACGIQFDWSVF